MLTVFFFLSTDAVDASLLSDLSADLLGLEVESWSLAVSPEFCKQHERRTVKQQDVIYGELFEIQYFIFWWICCSLFYWLITSPSKNKNVWSLSRVELIQTELHHIQTLTVMSEVFRRGMVEELQLDWDCVARIFPCLDSLLCFHRNFFGALQERRQAGTQADNPQNYVINQIGDVLLQQVGGWCCFTRKHTPVSITYGLFSPSFQMKMPRKWRTCMESSAAITWRLWMSSKNCCSKIKSFKTL